MVQKVARMACRSNARSIDQR